MRVITVLVTVVISIILLGAVLVPTLNSTTHKDENVLDVFVLGGQSNMAYIPAYMDLNTVNSELGAPAEPCYFFGTQTRPAYNGINLSDCDMYPMYSDGSWIIGGEECGLAYYLTPKTHNELLVINVGIPAYSIDQFEPGTTGGNHIVNTIEAALASIPSTYTVNKLGWAWCQGESDRTTAYANYIASFDKIDGMLSNLGFDMCYLVQTKPSDSGSATIAQQMIVSDQTDVCLASTAPAGFTIANGGLIEGNWLHYTQHGRIIVGEDIANAISIPDYESLKILYIVPIIVIAALLLIVARLYMSRD